jgi:hypothetical protein
MSSRQAYRTNFRDDTRSDASTLSSGRYLEKVVSLIEENALFGYSGGLLK